MSPWPDERSAFGVEDVVIFTTASLSLLGLASLLRGDRRARP